MTTVLRTLLASSSSWTRWPRRLVLVLRWARRRTSCGVAGKGDGGLGRTWQQPGPLRRARPGAAGVAGEEHRAAAAARGGTATPRRRRRWSRRPFGWDARLLPPPLRAPLWRMKGCHHWHRHRHRAEHLGTGVGEGDGRRGGGARWTACAGRQGNRERGARRGARAAREGVGNPGWRARQLAAAARLLQTTEASSSSSSSCGGRRGGGRRRRWRGRGRRAEPLDATRRRFCGTAGCSPTSHPRQEARAVRARTGARIMADSMGSTASAAAGVGGVGGGIGMGIGGIGIGGGRAAARRARRARRVARISVVQEGGRKVVRLTDLDDRGAASNARERGARERRLRLARRRAAAAAAAAVEGASARGGGGRRGGGRGGAREERAVRWAARLPPRALSARRARAAPAAGATPVTPRLRARVVRARAARRRPGGRCHC